MNKTKRWAGGFLLAISLFAAGCSQASTQSAGSEPQGGESGAAVTSGAEIKLGFNPWPGYFPFFIAEEKGIFEKYGLNVDVVLFPVLSDQLTAVSGGQLDVSGVTVNDLVVPLSKGVDLRAVGVVDISDGGDALVAHKSIVSLDQLKGKRIATELGTVDHLLMMVGLEQAGLGESDIQFTNMSMNDAGPALLSGSLDAASLYEPFVSMATTGGEHHVLFSSADVPGLIADLLVVKGEMADERPEDVKNMLHAWYDALEYWKANPEESLEIMAEAADLPVEEFAGVYDGIKMFTVDESIQAFEKGDDYGSLYFTAEKTVEFLKGLEFMDSDPDLDASFDPSFLEAIKAER